MFKRLIHDEHGSFAVIFALASVPMLMLGGMGIDYGNNLAVQQKAQNAVDATALTLSKLAITLTDEELQTRADKQIRAMVTDARLTEPVITAKRDGESIRIGITGQTPTSLTQILGFRSLPLSANSTVKRGTDNLEVALVLDNTGSMEGSKMTNLKSAANDLVDSMFKNANPARPSALKMAVVPFSMTVNIGAGYASSSFMDLNAASSTHKEIFADKSEAANRFKLLTAMNRSWGGCVETRPSPYDVQESPPSSGTPDTLYVPYFAPDESDSDGNAVNNYMADYPSKTKTKDQSSDNRIRQSQIEKYSSNTFTRIASDQNWAKYHYGPNSGCEITPITRLTTTKSTVKQAITDMKTVGDTNISTGLMWGWHVISPNVPFSDGSAYTDTKTKKFIILMTDGQNQNLSINSSNTSFYSGTGFVWNNRLGTTSNDNAVRTQSMNDRAALLCANVKKQGIQLFTIRVEVKEGTSDLLRNCATKPSMFYDVQNSSSLSGVFQEIASSINELRIAR